MTGRLRSRPTTESSPHTEIRDVLTAQALCSLVSTRPRAGPDEANLPDLEEAHRVKDRADIGRCVGQDGIKPIHQRFEIK